MFLESSYGLQRSYNWMYLFENLIALSKVISIIEFNYICPSSYTFSINVIMLYCS